MANLSILLRRRRVSPADRGITARLKLQQRTALTAWTFLAVPLLFYAAVRFWPAIDAFRLSLSRWNLVGPRVFVGLDNYARLFRDPVFLQVLGNTFAYLVLGLPISLLVAFVVAYHLDRLRTGQTILRALYFLPHLTTATAMAFVWRWLYQPPPIGVFNNAARDSRDPGAALSTLHLAGAPRGADPCNLGGAWLSNCRLARRSARHPAGVSGGRCHRWRGGIPAAAACHAAVAAADAGVHHRDEPRSVSCASSTTCTT